MRLVTAAVAIAVMGAFGGNAFAASYPKIPRNTSYEKARATMMAAGFTAAGTNQRDDCAIGREDICEKWPEAESCSGTGLGLCTFAWRKGRTVVEIITMGDEEIVVRRSSCREGC